MPFSLVPASLGVSNPYCDEQEFGNTNFSTTPHYASTSSSISQASSNNIKVSRLQCSPIPRDFFCPIYLITTVDTATINIIESNTHYIFRRTIQSLIKETKSCEICHYLSYCPSILSHLILRSNLGL